MIHEQTVFHDVNTMCGLFIHMMPPMTMYTLLWHTAEIRSAWPEIFHLDYIDSLHYFPTSPVFAPGSVRCADCIIIIMVDYH